MTRAVTIVGSSTAINDLWATTVGRSGLGLEGAFEPTDENFALTPSGHLWQVASARARAERDALTFEAARVNRRADKTRATIELLRSWRDGDQTEQTSTLKFLRTALDENRIRDAKLFERR